MYFLFLDHASASNRQLTIIWTDDVGTESFSLMTSQFLLMHSSLCHNELNIILLGFVAAVYCIQ